MTSDAARAVPAPPAPRHMSAGQWLELLLLSFIWGSSFFMIKIAVGEIPPLTLVFCRAAMAALALHLWMRAAGLRFPRDSGLWRQFAALGFINNVIPFSLIFWAETVIPSGLAGVLNATTPIWTVILTHFFMAGERASPSRVAGVLLGFAGTAALIGWQGGGGSLPALLGQLAVVLASLGYAIASIYGRRFAGLSSYATACGQLTATTVMSLPLCLLIDRPWALPLPQIPALLATVYLGLVSTALAYALYFRLLKAVGSLNIVLVTFLVPVSALALGMMFLDEALALSDYGGMALIALGLAAIDGRPFGFIQALCGKCRKPSAGRSP